MTEDQFFFSLLSKTETAFAKSDIGKRSNQWYYSVCGTPVRKGKGIVLGINWGVGTGAHSPQSEMPDGLDIATYNFFKRSESYLATHLKVNIHCPDFNYTNLCFFRTPDINVLTINDFRDSLKLFTDFVEFVEPPWIFSLGMTNSLILSQHHMISNMEVIQEGKHRGVMATVLGRPFFAVPHPNARVKKEARQKIWEKVGSRLYEILA